MVWIVLIVCLTALVATALVCDTVKEVRKDANDLERSKPKTLGEFMGGGN